MYRYWAALLFAAVLVQIGAAGYGAFYSANKLRHKRDTLAHHGFEHGWNFHNGLGYLIFVGAVILLLL